MQKNSINRVFLIGHLGGDPEARYTKTGRPVASFSVATNESWKQSDGSMKEQRANTRMNYLMLELRRENENLEETQVRSTIPIQCSSTGYISISLIPAIFKIHD